MFNNFFKLRQYYYIIFIIIKINYCEFNNNVNQRFPTNITAMHFFRFRDFEPRYALKNELFRPMENKRRPRGFQFHTDDSDFNVDLEFIVPFIRIPIERSMTATQTAFRSLLNLNAQSIFTTGAIVAIGGIFAIVLKILFTQYALTSNYRKSFRSNGFTTSEDDHFLNRYGDENDSEFILTFNKLATLMEGKLQENHINIRHCIQSSLCSYAQKCFFKDDKDCGDGLSRILSGMFSLHFFQDYLSGTSVKTALDTAQNGGDCSKAFNSCNLPFSPNFVLRMLTQNINFF